MHLRILRAVAAPISPQFVAVRLPGLDAVGHYFLRYAEPSAFGDVSPDEIRRYGRVLSEYYGFVDAVVGDIMKAMGPDDLLLVISGFGMEPLSPGKRMLERVAGNIRLSGSHERSPDGFLLAYGAAVAPAAPAAPPFWTLPPPCFITWACLSHAIWKASRARISFARTLPPPARSPSSRHTDGSPTLRDAEEWRPTQLFALYSP